MINNVVDHIKLLNQSGTKVLLTTSANGNGGRIVDFFAKNIQDPNTVFVICGWIYPGSPMHILHSTEPGGIVDFENRRLKKNCQTYRLHGFSSHGNLPEVFSKLYTYPRIKEVILNHGELKQKEEVRDEIYKEFRIRSHIPKIYDAYELSKTSIVPLEENDTLAIFGEVLNKFNMNAILTEIAELKEAEEE